MRAIQIEQFGDPAEVLRVVDIDEPPPPGPHEVLVSVEFSPLNKHDLLVVTGMLATTPAPHTRRRGCRPRACHWRRGRWTSNRRSGRATPVCGCVARAARRARRRPVFTPLQRRHRAVLDAGQQPSDSRVDAQ